MRWRAVRQCHSNKQFINICLDSIASGSDVLMHFTHLHTSNTIYWLSIEKKNTDDNSTIKTAIGFLLFDWTSNVTIITIGYIKYNALQRIAIHKILTWLYFSFIFLFMSVSSVCISVNVFAWWTLQQIKNKFVLRYHCW